MVWFQCEDCGENLKKPKLPTHFRMCSATKLSCIDCGEMFGKDSVQGHNQCITEAEKYGPKGQSKSSNGTPAKPKDSSKQQPDFDINVGLSNRYPWFCSICYTKATSQQTLLAHADGKKHRGKAKAFHARQQQSTVDKKDGSENASNGDSEQKKVDVPVPSSGVANGDSHAEKKRKLDTLAETSKGEVVQAEEAKGGELKKAKKQDHEKKINWKKLITSALKSNDDKTLKMKKLKKLVLESLVDSSINKSELKAELELKVNSSSRFTVDGKYVKLVAKD
ncbi:PREDICTED: UBP1-associated proteins 1C [Camelina sativa]|uniref:UBP1-associated proteins 1C n=1 Tax=Camelina sativa TaxID=90675 RepID=A0ABM0XQS0_CAMSA|nr:PREDICTED: UBP1-associated proteins 1C [Camelina sativa]